MAPWIVWLLACGVVADTVGPPPVSDDTDVAVAAEPGGTSVTDSATTPTDPGPREPVTEVFTYEPPQADVLFVIDASCSMIGNVEVLLGALESVTAQWIDRGLDFQAGAVSLDEGPAQGMLTQAGGERWASPAHPTPGALLRQLIGAVTDPSISEEGRAAVYKALEATDPGEPNEGFLRADSELVIILFTDASDASGADPISAAAFVDWFAALRDPERRGFHSIVDSDDYLQLTATLGGVAWNVFNTPYGPVLDAITDTVEPTNVFTLAGNPVPETLAVRVVGLDGSVSELAVDAVAWDPTAGTVDLLGVRPNAGDTVEISYVPVD